MLLHKSSHHIMLLNKPLAARMASSVVCALASTGFAVCLSSTPDGTTDISDLFKPGAIPKNLPKY